MIAAVVLQEDGAGGVRARLQIVLYTLSDDEPIFLQQEGGGGGAVRVRGSFYILPLFLAGSPRQQGASKLMALSRLDSRMAAADGETESSQLRSHVLD